jgi:hypothetical protein
MGGQIDWSALPVLAEVYDLENIDGLIERLEVIRTKVREYDQPST